MQSAGLLPFTLQGDWGRELAFFDPVVRRLTLRHTRGGGRCDVSVGRPRSGTHDLRRHALTALAFAVSRRGGRYEWAAIHDELLTNEWVLRPVALRAETLLCDVLTAPGGWAAVFLDEETGQWVKIVAAGDVSLAEVRLIGADLAEVAEIARRSL